MFYMIVRLFLAVILLSFFGCTQGVQSSLLSAAPACEASGTCNTTSSTTITGGLAVLPDAGEIAVPVDGTDIVEISGACKDLGSRKNRLLVQVFEGENAGEPAIIDNTINLGCQDGISTTSLRSVAGVPATCMLLTDGIGVADDTNSSSPTVQYPQCFNGRFSFQVRLGKIIRQDRFANNQNNITNPILRYMLRVKIRTLDGLPEDSGWSQVFLDRALAPLQFTFPTNAVSAQANADANRCEILFNPSKFRDIRYTLNTIWRGPTYAVSGAFSNTISGTIYTNLGATYPPVFDGSTVNDYFHFGEPLDASATIGLLPGVSYEYNMQSADYSYITDYNTQFGGPERSQPSASGTCALPAPYISQKIVSGNGSTSTQADHCTMQLAGYNPRSTSATSYVIEWRYSDVPEWMVTNPNGGFHVASAACSNGTSCVVTSATAVIAPGPVFTVNHPYYFAARQLAISNATSATILIGNWSATKANQNASTDPTQATNACTFSN